MPKTRLPLALAAAMASLVVIAFTAGSLLAQTPAPPGGLTHDQMHGMMDAMHGAGTSQRLHEAMGPDGEQMMDQCAAMMSMMSMMAHRPGMMMGSGGIPGMMGRQDTSSMEQMLDLVRGGR